MHLGSFASQHVLAELEMLLMAHVLQCHKPSLLETAGWDKLMACLSLQLRQCLVQSRSEMVLRVETSICMDPDRGLLLFLQERWSQRRNTITLHCCFMHDDKSSQWITGSTQNFPAV